MRYRMSIQNNDTKAKTHMATEKKQVYQMHHPTVNCKLLCSLII